MGFGTLSTFFVLVAVAILWRPNENASAYIYSFELGAGDDDDDDDNNSEEGVELAETGALRGGKGNFSIEGDEDDDNN